MTSALRAVAPSLRVIPELRRSFQEQSYVLVHEAIPEPTAEAWRLKAAELIAQRGITIRRDSDRYSLTYRVVTGKVIRDHWPELFDFYTAASTRDWICHITGERNIYTSKNLRSSININSMSDTGESYRWHFDAIPYTLLLFLTTSVPEDGGAFELVPRSAAATPDTTGATISILPRAGSVLLMDGTHCQHRVSPLLRPSQRLTIPMVFPNIPDDSRPDGLDDYLYES
ncbi:MAG TPA: 2OG-Fe(II) oxygenase [Terriglobales bacterium]|nr:2OG-Fe(II) oxygenase [Terriglobales bacterium]